MLSLIPSHPQRVPLPGSQVVPGPPAAVRAAELPHAAGIPDLDRATFQIIVVPAGTRAQLIPFDDEPTWEDAAWQ